MKRLRSLFWWHRTAGLLAALLLLVLALTGLLLNHPEILDLGQRKVAWAPLVRAYGIEAPTPQGPYPAAGYQVALLAPKLFIDDRRLEGDFQALNGAVGIDGLLWLATDRGLWLADPKDAAADRIDGPWDARPIQRIARLADGALLVQAGAQHYRSADGLEGWAATEPPPAADYSQALAEADLTAELQALFLADTLSWERLVADLHSGRVFGRYGPLLMDFAALAMLFLAASGFWLWRRQHRQQRKRRRR